MHRIKYTLVAIFLCFISWEATPQASNLGDYPVRHFSRRDYHAGTQNWDITQDQNGLLYFANNEGLLRFDGVHWDLFPVKNHTIVRSLYAHPDGRIFAGAQNELGYFFPSANGILTYHSLYHLLPATEQPLADVWEMIGYQGQIWFRTNQAVYRYDGTTIQRVYADAPVQALFATNDGLFIQSRLSQLLRLENQQFVPLLENASLQSEITGTAQGSKDTLFIATLKDGLFIFTQNRLQPKISQHQALFQNKRIYAATLLPNQQLALGSTQYGLLVQDAYDRITVQLDKSNGLQNSTVLSLFNDHNGNLWLGLDNGIDCINLRSPFTLIKPDGNLQGAGYTAAIQAGKLYLGVSNGLYCTDWKPYYLPGEKKNFRKINQTEGQTWGLKTLGGQLLLGHHEGAFALKGPNAQKISSGQGIWTFVPLDENSLLAGGYNGLSLFRKEAENWVLEQELQGINESCRIMVPDETGAIWISHPYRGIFRVKWSPKHRTNLQVDYFNESNGLPSLLNNYVFPISGKMVVGTTQGVYRFDPTTQRFHPDSLFNLQLGGIQWVKHLCQDPKGNIWYVTDQETGMLQVQDDGLKKTIQKKQFPQLHGKLVGGFEHIYPFDEHNVLLGAEEGFYLFDPSTQNPSDTSLPLSIHSVVLHTEKDSVLFGGQFVQNQQLSQQQPSDQIPELASWQNNLRFQFAAIHYNDPDILQYSTRILGLETKWSEWNTLTQRSINNLPPGKYTFQVRARRLDGLESTIVSYQFRIQPPWYAGKAALTTYVLALIALIAGLQIRQRRKFETEKALLQKRHQQTEAQQRLEVQQTQAELSTIRNEKLEAEIQFKNQKLAATTMHLVQKNEMLVTISETLRQVLEQSTSAAVKKDLRQVLNLLNFDQKLDEDWEQFAQYFDQVHVNFLGRVREKFPKLSQNDYKLCAYLRMNLSTKEIASLMNISVRGVEASRYRLRKRLELPNETNLNEFIMQL
ncbi:MAG: triple tyrosine motif-containing protein [Chitinophagales bacterium]|jgi:ligand-binding sensor domain-containing protein/DNA-binding CsgD family transcriptional regulator